MRRWNLLLTVSAAALVMLTGAALPPSQAAVSLNIDVKEFQLDNGMLFLVVRRPATPQVAVRLAIRAGSALEDTGKTGIAHLLEHMMFKGTKNFGTLDPEKDQKLQEKIEAAYQVVLAEKRKRQPDPERIREKLAEMEALRLEVQQIFVPQAFSAQLGKNGAVGINAFTTKDQTQYIASVPADMLEQWFSIISEQIFEPAWREFYVEKEVVQREWAFRYVNNPAGAAWLDLDATAYSAHPYRNPTIGWRSDMDFYNTDDAMAFHVRHYNPTNAVCVLVGDVTLEEVRRLAQTYFARYPAGSRSPEVVTREPVQQGLRQSVRYLEGARTPLVRIGFQGARMGTKDFYALDVLTMALSQGRSARMTQNLVNQGLAVEAWAYNPDNRYGGMVVLGGSPLEPAALDDANLGEEERRRHYLEACRELENRLLAEVETLQQQPLSERELSRIKKLNEREFIERMRSNENLAGTLATLEVQQGWGYLNGYLESIAAVTPEDVQQAARRYLEKEKRTSAYVIPGGQPQNPPEAYEEVRNVGGAAAARLSRPTDLQNHSMYPTPQGWKHPLSFERHPIRIDYPEAEKTTIGSTPVFFIPDNELPLVDLTLLVKAGEVDLDPSLNGLGAIINGSLIDGGTELHAPEELARILDENAIEMSVSVNEEETVITLSVLKEDWRKGLDLLREVLTRPLFDPRVVAVVKEQTLIGLKRRGEDAQAVAMREAMIRHFQGHPYGRDPMLGLKTIPEIGPNDLRGFLRTYVVPSNIVIAVSGDISKDEVTDGLSLLLAALPQSRPPQRRIGDPDPTRPVLALIDKPGQVQSQVILMLPGVKRSDPDFWKLRLLADIFGGSDSLMYTRLRDDLGLVYSAGFFQMYKWHAGMLVGYIGCKADQTGTAIEETLGIMNELHRRVPKAEAERKRLEALNSFVFNVDSPNALANTYARYRMRGEPLDTLEKIQETYLATSEKDLHRLATDFLVPERVQIFVVADKSVSVGEASGGRSTLDETLKRLAAKLDLAFEEIALR